MGKIWLETTSGKLIHLPVVGDDVNTPDDSTKIPTSIMNVQARCYGESVVIDHPTYGSFTIDLMPPGMSGLCNQCGMCCGHPVTDCSGGPHSPIACGYILNEDINWHVCQYLTIKSLHKWGEAKNTECSLYLSILDTFKGCAYPPLHYHPWMTGCGYSF